MYISLTKMSQVERARDRIRCCHADCTEISDYRLSLEKMIWRFCEQHMLDALLDAVNFATADQQDVATLTS